MAAAVLAEAGLGPRGSVAFVPPPVLTTDEQENARLRWVESSNFGPSVHKHTHPRLYKDMLGVLLHPPRGKSFRIPHPRAHVPPFSVPRA